MKKQQSQIRFGLMCNGFQFPFWQVETLKKTLAASDVSLELIIVDSKKKTAASPIPVAEKESLLWRIYKKKYVSKKSKALKSQDFSKVLKNIPQVKCESVVENNNAISFEKKDVETITSYNLDFILKFELGKICGEILNSAKHGVWEFHHSDPSKYSGKTYGFWEIFNGDLVTGAALRRLTDDADQEIILKTGFLKTELFLPKNIDKIHYESSRWVLQLCVDIRHQQDDNLNNPTPKSPAVFHPSPSNYQLIVFFFKQIKILLKKAYKTLFITDYWNIGVAQAPITAFLNPEHLPKVDWFPKLPKNKFIADPFGIYHNGELHIIYEDFLFRERIGTTAALQFENGKFQDNGIVIKENFHMSYPFVFEQNDEIYCIPETYQAQQVRLYKATDFPTKWELDRVLIENYHGIDNTLLEHDDLWWLFSTNKQDGAHYNLNIFYAENLFGEWKKHPKNPVKTDFRSARPAGTIFRHEGEIYRPSMDYSEKVEGRIIINKILKLTKTDFKEENTCTINPYQNTYFSDKIHTLSQTGDLTIIDGAKELFVLGNIHALKYKLISLLGKIKK